MQSVLNTLRWLSLIAPSRFIFGTRNNDVLAARAEGDIVFGLAGDDILSSAFNRTALIGGSDDDRLTTEFTAQFQPSAPARAVAVQLGDRGDDTMRAHVGLAGETPTNVAGHTIDILLDGGSDDDVIDARAFVVTPALIAATFTIQVLGGSGNDSINAVADATGSHGDSVTNVTVHGGGGNDRIVVRADTDHVGTVTTTENVLTGGDGDDVLDAEARGDANFTELVSNHLDGGNGDDVLRAFNLTDSNGAAPVGINRLLGGDGDDSLEAIHSTDGENGRTDVTSILDGGSGNDILRADTTALGLSALALNSLDGGRGHDMLSARLVALAIGGAPSGPLQLAVSNVLNGGIGNDSLEAFLSAEVSTPEEDDRAENHLNGGSGNDRLLATVAPGSLGTSFLNGGAGDDLLTVVGGTDNVLNGGDGRDRLDGGVGNDRFLGGRGVDTFRIDPTSDEGEDIIADFAFASDIFSFAGLTDQGTAGLVDDLDALSAFDDLGAGDDVIVTFDAGTELTLAGLGTGAVDSWADLVANPSTQLLLA
jgi:Ca2+-binding RTX toxin-like protein